MGQFVTLYITIIIIYALLERSRKWIWIFAPKQNNTNNSKAHGTDFEAWLSEDLLFVHLLCLQTPFVLFAFYNIQTALMGRSSYSDTLRANWDKSLTIKLSFNC